MVLRSVLLWVVLIVPTIHQNEVQAQSAPCILPRNTTGTCVAIERCRNIYSLVMDPSPQARKYDSYIKKAACTLPGISRSICCSPREVSRERSTTSTTSRVPTCNKQDLLSMDCGKIATDRISYGNVTKVFTYPWMAILRYNESGIIGEKCGGSLINKRYVLTAAHCLKTKTTIQLHSVILGEHTKDQAIDCNIYYDRNGIETERECADPTEEFGIEWTRIHHNYNRPKYSNDIGLIRLDRDVQMKDHIKPVCLPITPELQAKTFQTYIVTGWGTTENNTASNVLLEANLHHVDIDTCQRMMRKFRMIISLSDKQLCAQGKNLVDACRGDSGGPLVSMASYAAGSARFIQLGIVTTGIDSCGQKSAPGVYCRVASYMDWILEQIECGA